MFVCLFEPDIPQNLGSIIRLCACFGVALHIIEPCGFPLDDKRLRRVAMDYVDQVTLIRHASWEAFLAFKATHHPDARLLLLSTRASVDYTNFYYRPDDWLLFGRESAGVPEEVHTRADQRLRIPVQSQARSLNLVQAASVVLAEGLRQTNRFPQSA